MIRPQDALCGCFCQKKGRRGQDKQMYKVTVPINLGMLEAEGPEAYLADVARFGAERVFFCCAASLGNGEADKKTFEAIRKNAAVFHAHGYEVGCWFCPLMQAMRLPSSEIPVPRMMSVSLPPGE